MKNVRGMLVVMLLLGGAIGCQQEGQKPEEKYPILSAWYRETVDLKKECERREPLFRSMEKLMSSLRKHISVLPEGSTRKELEEALQDEEWWFRHYVDHHNFQVWWYNVTVEGVFDREELTKAIGKPPLQPLEEWKVSK